MYDNILKPFENYAAAAFDGIAQFFGTSGSDLREPPSDGTVTLPEDLFAKPDVQTEWWYYTGHCETESGRQFGFELVFFKRRTDRDRLGSFPMTLLANPMYFAHFAISDVTAKTFRYEHIRSFNKPFDVPVSMSETACDIRMADWSLREVAGKHLLHATLEDGLVFDAVLESDKPIVLNGDGGSGITRKKNGASNHFSYTRMNVEGQTSTGGEIERFTGAAWMDREFGTWDQGNWDWFSIQFDDETELMIYQFRAESGDMNGQSTGTFVRRDGTCEYLERKDFEIDALSTWTSEKTGAEYPSLWHVRVQRLGIDIEITPFIDDQELDTRGSTMVVYWEGACSVTGTRAENPVSGRAYVELVGYDRTHEKAGMGDFLFGRRFQQVKDLFG
ncbi:lipocalin-like domain-containing protein [soil metagenome]